MTTEAWIDRLEQQNAEIKKLLEDFIKNSTSQQASMDQRQQRIEEKLDSKGSKGGGDRGESSINWNRDKHSEGSHNSVGAKVAKLEFPKYNGTDDPTTWICRVDQYFDFKQIEEGEKLPLVAYHLDGESQMWYHNRSLTKMVGQINGL